MTNLTMKYETKEEAWAVLQWARKNLHYDFTLELHGTEVRVVTERYNMMYIESELDNAEKEQLIPLSINPI